MESRAYGVRFARLFLSKPFSETQGQIVGARKSLNGRKKGAKKSKERVPLLFFAPFFPARLDFFLAPTICPWVSEDVSKPERARYERVRAFDTNNE